MKGEGVVMVSDGEGEGVVMVNCCNGCWLGFILQSAVVVDVVSVVPSPISSLIRTSL